MTPIPIAAYFDDSDYTSAVQDDYDEAGNLIKPEVKKARMDDSWVAIHEAIFKKVGFNDQALVKEIMEMMNKIPASVAKSAKIKRRQGTHANKKSRSKSVKGGNHLATDP